MQSSASSTDGAGAEVADSTASSAVVTEKNGEGLQLLSQAAKRVWEELYVNKRQVFFESKYK